MDGSIIAHTLYFSKLDVPRFIFTECDFKV